MGAREIYSALMERAAAIGEIAMLLLAAGSAASNGNVIWISAS